MPCYTPLKGYVNTKTGGIVFNRDGIYAGKRRDVACGQCLGCRTDKQKEWAARIVHESTMQDENCFITLTYRNWDACNEEQLRDGWYVPQNGSLNKKHFQKFMKRLRKKFGNKRIRYYQCGEYGSQMDRPHYHACLFNVEFVDQQLLKESEGNFLFTSKTLEELWPYGFSTVAELTYQSAAYCAGYVTKKITGKQAHDYYLRCDEYGVAYWLQPEYATMSRGGRTEEKKDNLGGLGKSWYEKYHGDVFPSDECPVPGKGVVKKVPKFYEKILRIDNEEEFDRLKDKRKKYLEDNIEEFQPARLRAKYEVAKARSNLSNTRSYENADDSVRDF